MEIVPILSTIILVGTLATFILAVAAYVLYKVREGRVSEEAQYAEADAYAMANQPAEAATYMAPTGTTPPGDLYIERMHTESGSNFPPVNSLNEASGGSMPLSSFFWEYTNEGFLPVDPQSPAGSSGDGSAPLDTADNDTTP